MSRQELIENCVELINSLELHKLDQVGYNHFLMFNEMYIQ